MQIVALVLLAAIQGAVVYWLLRRNAHQKRKNLLIERWRKVMPELMYQCQFVPPGTPNITDTSQLSARDLANIAISQMSDDGVDPDALSPAARKEAFDAKVGRIKAWLMGGEGMDGRDNYERLIGRALEILQDTGTRYTRQQRIAAELLLSTGIGELMKVRASEAEGYYQRMCSKVAAASMSEGTAGAGPAAAGPRDAGEDFKNAIAERAGARVVAEKSGVDPASVHRQLAVNQEGKVRDAIAAIDATVEEHLFDAMVEEHLYDDKLEADSPEGKQAFRRKLYPLACAAIATLDLSLADTVRVCSALGIETPELGIEDLEVVFAAARAAEKAGTPAIDAWAEFRKAAEMAVARFAKWEPLWRIIGTRYGPFLAVYFRSLEISEQPEGGLFSTAFEYKSWDEWHPVRIRQIEPDATLVYDSARRYKSEGTGPAVHLLLGGGPEPAVTWRVGEGESVNLAAALAVTRMKGLEKELHISLDGSRTLDGLPGGPRWAVVRRDRISGEIKGIEARGQASAAAGGG